jgi:hypothetical protein
MSVKAPTCFVGSKGGTSTDYITDMKIVEGCRLQICTMVMVPKTGVGIWWPSNCEVVQI